MRALYIQHDLEKHFKRRCLHISSLPDAYFAVFLIFGGIPPRGDGSTKSEKVLVGFDSNRDAGIRHHYHMTWRLDGLGVVLALSWRSLSTSTYGSQPKVNLQTFNFSVLKPRRHHIVLCRSARLKLQSHERLSGQITNKQRHPAAYSAILM